MVDFASTRGHDRDLPFLPNDFLLEHCTALTSDFTLQNFQNFLLDTSHFKLHTSHFKLERAVPARDQAPVREVHLSAQSDLDP
jgi:hypothetical protein